MKSETFKLKHSQPKPNLLLLVYWLPSPPVGSKQRVNPSDLLQSQRQYPYDEFDSGNKIAATWRSGFDPAMAAM